MNCLVCASAMSQVSEQAFRCNNDVCAYYAFYGANFENHRFYDEYGDLCREFIVRYNDVRTSQDRTRHRIAEFILEYRTRIEVRT